MGRSGGHICFPFCRFRDEPSVWPHPEQPAWGWLTSSPPPAPASPSAARCRFFFLLFFFPFFYSLTAHKPEPSLLSQGTGRRWFVWFAAASSGRNRGSCPLSFTCFIHVVTTDKTRKCSMSWDGFKAVRPFSIWKEKTNCNNKCSENLAAVNRDVFILQEQGFSHTCAAFFCLNVINSCCLKTGFGFLTSSYPTFSETSQIFVLPVFCMPIYWPLQQDFRNASCLLLQWLQFSSPKKSKSVWPK